MSLRSLVPLFVLAACTSGDPADDGKDDTDTDVAADTDTVDDTDGGPVDDTDGAVEPGVATNWTGTWSFTWVDYVQDYSYPGPGERWDPRDSSCSAGTVSLTIGAAGVVTVLSPYGTCSAGTQQGWTHMTLSTALGEDGTSLTGDVLFGNLGPTLAVQAVMGLPVTGTLTDDGDVPLGLLSFTAGRSNNAEQPHFNHQFRATLRPVAD